MKVDYKSIEKEYAIGILGIFFIFGFSLVLAFIVLAFAVQSFI